jgi:hypothetical protein
METDMVGFVSKIFLFQILLYIKINFFGSRVGSILRIPALLLQYGEMMWVSYTSEMPKLLPYLMERA